MMKRLLIVGFLTMTLLAACGGGAEPQATGPGREHVVELYKLAT